MGEGELYCSLPRVSCYYDDDDEFGEEAEIVGDVTGTSVHT